MSAAEPGAPEPAAAGTRRLADLRLFGPAAGAWASTLFGLHTHAPAALAVAGVAALLAAAAYRAGVRRPAAYANPRWIAAGVLLGVACGGLATAARTATRDAAPLAALVWRHAQVSAELTVTDDPRRLTPHGPGPTTLLVPARLTYVAEGTRNDGVGGVRLDARVLVFATDPAWRPLLPGQRLGTNGRLAPARGGDLTAAVLSATGAPHLRGPPPWTQRAAGRLRAGLQQACAPLPPAPGGLLPGLVIGDTSRLDPALEEQFRRSGLTHLVAVSGANIAVLLAVVLFVARWCRAGPRTSAVVCAVALAGFVVLARPSPSVVRAAAMGLVGLLALVSGRPRAASPALAAAVLAGLLIDPALAADVGFALSALATGGLVLLAPRWRDALRARGWPAGVAEALAVPAAAQVACAPLIAAISGTVSLVAVPANLLAVPAVAPATVLGVGAAGLSPLWPDGASFLVWLASWPAWWLVRIAQVGAATPAGSLGWPGGLGGGLMLALLTGLLLVVARRPVLRRLAVVIAVATAVGAVPVRLLASGWPPAGAVVVACAVGQGDAIVLPAGAGEAVVVDAGPEPDAVDGCLRGLRIVAVPLLVITHFHADHVGGVAGVVRGRRLGAVALPGFGEPVAGAQAVLATAQAAGAEVIHPEPGWHYTRGDLALTVLGPGRRLTGTRSDPNNNSLILRATAGAVSVLLAGDAETEEQDELLADLGAPDLRADVLKVAHHGSAYQDPVFLDAVHPAVALVSVGADNDYGHPNAAVLARLTLSGARVLRTDRDGDLAVTRTNTGLAVVTHPP